MENKTNTDFLLCVNGCCPRRQNCYRYRQTLRVIAADRGCDRRYRLLSLDDCRDFSKFREDIREDNRLS